MLWQAKCALKMSAKGKVLKEKSCNFLFSSIYMIFFLAGDILAANCRDANINIQKIGRIQTKNLEVFKITCNFNGTKLIARNREVAKFGCQNGTEMLTKLGTALSNREGWHL